MVFRTFIFLAIGQKLDFWIVYDLDSVDTAEVAGRPIDESFLENIDTDFAVHFFGFSPLEVKNRSIFDRN